MVKKYPDLVDCSVVDRPNQLRFVLPTSSHMATILGSFITFKLFAFALMAQLYMTQNMSEKSKEEVYQEVDPMT